MKVLAGDVGGTHTRLALIEVAGADRPRVHLERDYPSSSYEGLVPIVTEFRGELEAVPGRACFGVACPVLDGRCNLPNLDWELEEAALADEIGIPDTRLINDFDAIGHAVELLGPDDRVELQSGEAREGEPIAIIGAGTGLGQGFLTPDRDGYRVHSSEGGHADFAPRTGLECRLFEFLLDRYAHVSYERVVSGPGLLNIYRFLVETGFAPETAETRQAMERGDPPEVISRRGLAGADELCVKALDIFASVYGAQAGNLALTLQAAAGVYLAGGIAPSILDKLRDGTFVRAFREKGRLSGYMADIPVRVIVNERVGLLGAAAAARKGGRP